LVSPNIASLKLVPSRFELVKFAPVIFVTSRKESIAEIFDRLAKEKSTLEKYALSI
jgi:hypothetical protein